VLTPTSSPFSDCSRMSTTIDQFIDVDAFNHEIAQEKADATKLTGVRRVMLDTFHGWTGEEANAP